MITELEKLVIALIGDGISYQKMLQLAQQQTTTFAAKIEQLGNMITESLTKPLIALAGMAVKAFSSFDLEMTKSTSIMKVTEDQIKAMRDAAIEMSLKSTRSAAEIAAAYYHLASAGLTAEQAIKAMPSIINFATAGVLDLATAARLSTTSLMALGLASKDTDQYVANLTNVMDMLVRVSKLAEANTEQFAQALTRDAASTMRSFGIPLEEGIALLGAYAKQNTTASLAGNTFGRMIRLVTGAFVKHRKAFEGMNPALRVFDEATGNLRPLGDILEGFEKSLGHLNDEGRVMAFNALGIPPLTQKAILPLIGLSHEFRNMEKEMGKVRRTSQDITNKQLKALANQLLIVKNNVMALGIEIGEVLAPYVLLLAQGIQAAVVWWRSLSRETKKATAILLVFVAVIIPLALAIGLLGPALLAGFKALLVVFAPILPILIALGIAFGMIVLYTGSVENAFTAIQETAVSVWESIKEAVGGFVTWATPIWNAFVSFITTAWEKVSEVFRFWADSAMQAVQLFGFQVSEVWTSIFGQSETTWAGIRANILDAFIMAEFSLNNFWELMAYAWTDIKLSVVSFANEFTYVLTVLMPAAWDYFINGWKNGWSTFPQVAARELGNTEKELMQSLAKQDADITKAYKEFHTQKLNQFNDGPLGPFVGPMQEDVVKKAENLGKKTGEGFTGAAKKEFQRFDAVLAGSAEAITRIAEYREKTFGTGGFAAGSNIPRVEASLSGSTEANTRAEEALVLQRRQNQLLESIAANTGNGVESADLSA